MVRPRKMKITLSSQAAQLHAINGFRQHGPSRPQKTEDFAKIFQKLR
jgi:hypothetical protein